MNIKTQKGRAYAVCSGSGCTVTTETGMILCTVDAGVQACFVSPGGVVEVSDDAAIVTPCEGFNGAATAALGGGAKLTVDQTFSATSENPQSGKAVEKAFSQKGIYTNSDRVGVGIGAEATVGSVAVGRDAKSEYLDVAIGRSARVVYVGNTKNTICSNAIGCYAVVKDGGVTLLSNYRLTDDAQAPITNFYIISANSPLANAYENGEACLGYVVKLADGTVLACGTRKLSELLTNNTAFAPAALDLDAPAPTPFMPTGITDPIELTAEDTVALN